MKIEIRYCNKWAGNPPVHYCQLIDVWFDNEEFELFKAKCYQAFTKYYAFYEIEMFLSSEERNKIASFIGLDKNPNFKPKRNTVIIYHKDYEAISENFNFYDYERS